jgi:tetratricopeptide (TPR) repeat protein
MLLAAVLITMAGVAAYANSFRGPFVCDDLASIPYNPTIRQLQDIGTVLSPPRGGETVSGRPLLNLSLAVDYALGGCRVWGYHATNLAIHILCALLLFGILRRTLTGEGEGGRRKAEGKAKVDGGQWMVDGAGLTASSALCSPPSAFPLSSTFLALTITLLWTVHPLQTESVTYIIQRAQSLASLFYLLLLYSVIRGATSTKATRWYLVAILASLLGMATKEIVATAPLLVLLYDRTFLAGTFGQTLRRRWGLYLGLAATWGLLAYLVYATGLLGRRAEFDSPDVWSYARSQPGVILYYLRLCLWPHPLCIDYAWPVAKTWQAIVPGTIVVGFLMVVTVWGLIRRRSWAFLGAGFFLLLAPTSSVLPLGGAASEHWLYLPLAAVVTALVLLAYRAGQSLVRRGILSAAAAMVTGGCLTLVACAALGFLTARRNADYRSALSIWEDTVAKSPHNPRAHNNLGTTLLELGRLTEATVHFQQAVRIRSDYVKAYNNLGAALIQQGRFAEAIDPCRKAVTLAPQSAEPHYNLGNALGYSGQIDDAIAQFEESLRINPGNANAHNNLALALVSCGRLDDAITHYRQALKIDPQMMEAHLNLGNACHRQGNLSAAIQHWCEAIRLRPKAISISILNQTAWILATCADAAGRNGAKAVELAERAARLTARRDAAVLDTLAAAYAETGRFSAAVETAQQALELASAQSNRPLAEHLRQRIDLYRNAKPYRVPIPIPPGP